jgi:kinesin family protein 5
MSAKTVKVVCRFRFEKPFDLDGKEDPFDNWEVLPEESTIKIKDKTFTYDAVLNSDTTQENAYEKVGRETISDFMNGFNATIFAYGQSGSGKTFSMVGPDEINDQLALDFKSIPSNIQQLFGTIPRATVQMFELINQYISEGAEYNVTCSYVEIYMEEITCLLSLKDKLKIKEYPDGNVEVEGKQKVVCKCPEDIFKVIATGTKNKTTGGTKQNARSSRSHTLLVVETESKTLDGQKKKSKLNLIDLAGSEKNRNTGATGDRAKEAIKINLSLTSLNMVFMALTTPGENKYIPFKDSKLTRLLKDSLGGNSLTTLLCT